MSVPQNHHLTIPDVDSLSQMTEAPALQIEVFLIQSVLLAGCQIADSCSRALTKIL
jgi:hypothetical protein